MEYVILQPSEGEYEELSIIVYAKESTYSVSDSNDEDTEAIDRQSNDYNDDGEPWGRVRVTIETVSDLDDKTYFSYACFSVDDKDTLEKNDIGFGVSTMDDASNLEILDITMLLANGKDSAKAVSDDQNGWDMDYSTGTGGGLSTTFEWTLYAKSWTTNLGI